MKIASCQSSNIQFPDSLPHLRSADFALRTSEKYLSSPYFLMIRRLVETKFYSGWNFKSDQITPRHHDDENGCFYLKMVDPATKFYHNNDGWSIRLLVQKMTIKLIGNWKRRGMRHGGIAMDFVVTRLSSYIATNLLSFSFICLMTCIVGLLYIIFHSSWGFALLGGVV